MQYLTKCRNQAISGDQRTLRFTDHSQIRERASPSYFQGPLSDHIALQRDAMAPKNKGKFKAPAKGHKKRPTHFLCFPLVTEDSIPQLKQSLAKFREVTMQLSTGIRRDLKAGDEVRKSPSLVEQTGLPSGGTDQHEGASSSNEAARQPVSDDGTDTSLRLLPAEAHRPPGTFHFTLGTMDLSEKEDMERALRLLQDIDYIELLSQATMIPEGQKRQRRQDNYGENSEHMDLIRQSQSNSAIGVSQPTSQVPSSKPLSSLTRDISPPRPNPISAVLRSMSTNQDATLVSPPKQLSVTLHSLGTFPSSQSARVFYAQPHEPSGILQTFGQLIRQKFMDAELITETRPLVLHATVANLIYVKRKGRGRENVGKGNPGGDGSRDGTVDARNILRYFNTSSDGIDQDGPRDTLEEINASSNDPKPFVWASGIPIDKIRICKMGAEKCDLPDWGMEYKPVGEKMLAP